MSTVRDQYIHLSDQERRERIADLLARGCHCASAPHACERLLLPPSPSPRHCIRLHRRRDFIQTGYIREALPRIIAAHVASWPFLVPAILVVLAWAAFLGFSARSVVVASIGFYIIATLPHHLLGMLVLDRRGSQGQALSPSGLYTTTTG